MLQFLTQPHNGGAKDGEFEMSLGRFFFGRWGPNSGRNGASGLLQGCTLAIAGGCRYC